MNKFFNFYRKGSCKENKIALTFDDGPSKETEKVLDLLKKFNAKATFFIWGKKIKGREKIIKRILREGHEIGNHTHSHKWLIFKSYNFIKKDILSCDIDLEKVGIQTSLFRFPAFKWGLISFIACLKLRKKVIFCDVVSNDWLRPWLRNKNKLIIIKIAPVIKKVIRRTKNGSIINFHDYLQGVGSHKEIIPILEGVLPELKKKKYKFVTVSELLKFKKVNSSTIV